MSDRELRRLEAEARSGDVSAITAYFQAMLRLKRDRELPLELRVPAVLALSGGRVGDVREEIVDEASEVIWLLAYSDWASREHEEWHNAPDDMDLPELPGPGGAWEDVTPVAPAEATRVAEEFVSRVEQLNGYPISALYAYAAEYPGRHYGDVDPEAFAEGIVFEAYGTGAGWHGNHPDTGLQIPSLEDVYSWDGENLEWGEI